jgi:predicted branched-subunit amino acid permease
MNNKLRKDFGMSRFISTHSVAFREGIRDGTPIALGYLAVSFSLGIAARNAGLSAFQGFLASFFNNASAGEYAAFTMIAASAAYWEIAVITLIANARYLLMSCALSQKFAPGTPFFHRLLVGFDVTDELFGIQIARPGSLDPYYAYGAFLVALPGWSFGTALGIIAGNILPLRVVSALSVALYGMFLAVIIPPARKDKVVAGLVLLSFAASFAAARLPIFSKISSGTRTIVLTVVISAAAAVFFPVSPKQVSPKQVSPKKEGAENEA